MSDPEKLIEKLHPKPYWTSWTGNPRSPYRAFEFHWIRYRLAWSCADCGAQGIADGMPYAKEAFRLHRERIH